MKRIIIGPIRVVLTILTGISPWMTLVMLLKVVGHVRDLSDGAFDLGTKLRRVRRVAKDLLDMK